MVCVTAIARHENPNSEWRTDASSVVANAFSKRLDPGVGINRDPYLGVNAELGWAAMAGHSCWWNANYVGRERAGALSSWQSPVP
mmetsp:Transcript_36322/g.81849  ORF Transcript_36322/g.81849 Transcript_36322/m.81849 type:complete len:85 (-) Transcript_36322:134-388(-)